MQLSAAVFHHSTSRPQFYLHIKPLTKEVTKLFSPPKYSAAFWLSLTRLRIQIKWHVNLDHRRGAHIEICSPFKLQILLPAEAILVLFRGHSQHAFNHQSADPCGYNAGGHLKVTGSPKPQAALWFTTRCEIFTSHLMSIYSQSLLVSSKNTHAAIC